MNEKEFSRKWPTSRPTWLDTKFQNIENEIRKENKGKKRKKEPKDKPDMIKLTKEQFINRMVRDKERKQDGRSD